MNVTRKITGLVIVAAISLFFMFFTPGSASAEEPGEVLKTIVEKIKAAENPAPVVDYVMWGDVFKGLSDEEKLGLQVKSPEEMKQLYRKMLENPAAAMKEQFAERVKQQAGGNDAMVAQVMAQFDQQMAAKQEELKARIRETTYAVGESRVEGETAFVQLSQTYQGQTKTDEVKMVRSDDGHWLLTSLGMAKQGDGARGTQR